MSRAGRCAAAALLAALALGASGSGDRIVARLFGQPITRAEVSAPVAFQIYQHEVAIHGLLAEEARRLADERVLAREALRRGMLPQALLAEIEASAKPVSDADVERYFSDRESAAGTRPKATPRVRHYLAETRKIELRLAFLERLRAEAGYRWLADPPRVPRTAVDVDGAPSRGSAAAPVTIVHFASFASSDSAASARALASVAGEHPNQIRLVHCNFLREGDQGALRAAEAGFAASDAGRFWQLHDALFAREGRIDAGALRAALDEAGLPPDLVADERRGALSARVKRDLEAGRRAGVLREPSVFVNGVFWSGLRPFDELRALVRQELSAGGAHDSGSQDRH